MTTEEMSKAFAPFIILKCKKVKYASVEKAEIAMYKINKKSGFSLRNAYLCYQCNAWHLTSSK